MLMRAENIGFRHFRKQCLLHVGLFRVTCFMAGVSPRVEVRGLVLNFKYVFPWFVVLVGVRDPPGSIARRVPALKDVRRFFSLL